MAIYPGLEYLHTKKWILWCLWSPVELWNIHYFICKALIRETAQNFRSSHFTEDLYELTAQTFLKLLSYMTKQYATCHLDGSWYGCIIYGIKLKDYLDLHDDVAKSVLWTEIIPKQVIVLVVNVSQW